MIIYVITKGEYSDYGICAVTENKEKAELLKKYYSDEWNEAKIEEYDTENPATVNLEPMFKIYFDDKGNIESIKEYNNLDYESEERISYYDSWVNSKGMFVSVKAETKEQAIKIASERRAKCLAEEMEL